MSTERIIPGYLKNRIAELPVNPGVYFFKNREGNPVYIGKALSIKKRVAGHFRYYGESFSKEGALLAQTTRIDFIETPTEAEALLLESSLVKQFTPKYNQELKDDKSYPYLKLTAEEYPRLLVARGRRVDGARYFGPYTDARLLRRAVTLLRRQFPLRTCKTLPKKVCLQFHIGLCHGPCEGHQSREQYLATVRELADFLEGRRDAMVRNLSRRMKEHSKKNEFEEAKVLYEQIRALSLVPAVLHPQAVSENILETLKEKLELPRLPRRIDCFDISNIQGAEAVASMAVFIDGKPARGEYRRFRIKTVKGIDDYRMMKEVVKRRYSRIIEEKSALPDLVVIDGGKGHLAAAHAQLKEIGLENLPLVSIAKEHEYIYSPGRQAPYVFSPTSTHLALIRRLRDEAHRFAITYHRKLHRKEAVLSALDSIPGVGPKMRQRLFRKIGPVAKIRMMAPQDLAHQAGISEKTAQGIVAFLSQ